MQPSAKHAATMAGTMRRGFMAGTAPIVAPLLINIKDLICAGGLSWTGLVASSMKSMPKKPVTPNVGLAIRRMRIGAGLTQAELAHRMHSADATLSRIERGKFSPSQAMLEGIAAALGCSVRDFFEAVAKTPGKTPRPAQAKLLAITADMTDAEIDDVVRAIKILVRVGRRTSARP